MSPLSPGLIGRPILMILAGVLAVVLLCPSSAAQAQARRGSIHVSHRSPPPQARRNVQFHPHRHYRPPAHRPPPPPPSRPPFHRVGHVTVSLPRGHISITVGGLGYYYHGGMYYQRRGGSYVVVTAPVGATISVLPIGYTTVHIGGVVHYQYGGVHYRPYYQNGVVVYRVVRI